MADLIVPAAEPWLEPFIEDGDEDLDVVRKRFDQAQDTVKRELRRQHVPVALRVRAGKTLTTSLEDLKP
jgi:hypothetical protein